MRLLDLFCGAGGAAMGYHRAGFEVVGVDIEPQPNYPFEFIQGDALNAVMSGFDAFHASPPCQAYTVVRNFGGIRDAPDLIDETRRLLHETGLPYVIENVPGAPLRNPIQLCGSAFALGVRRHRLFETSFPFMSPGCVHGTQAARYPARHSSGLRSVVSVFGRNVPAAIAGPAMGIDWMTNPEMGEAIPPAYTEHIGGYLLAHLRQPALSEASGGE